MPPRGARAHSPTHRRPACPGSAGWTCQNTPGESRHSRPRLPGRAAAHRRAPSSPDVCTTPVGVDRHLDLAAAGSNPRSSTGGSAPGGASGQSAMGSTSWLRCARSPARPSSSTASRTRCASPAGRPGSSSTWTRRSIAGEPAQLLGQDLRPSRPRCAAGATCCRSQPPQPPARAQAHGRGHPVRRRLEHLDGVGAAERAAAVLGDHGAHPLARQRVPDEHDPAVVAGHAVPAVGDRRRPASSRIRSVQSSSAGVHVSGSGSAAGVRRPGRLAGPRCRSRGRDRAGRGLGATRLDPLRGRQLPRHAGHHHPGLEQQPALEPQRALVVQQVLPPVPDHVLGDEDGDHVARGVAADPLRRSRGSAG